MARAAVAAMAAGLLATAALADPAETVVVENGALTGIWKIDLPESAVLEDFGRAQFGTLKPRYCRVEERRGGRLEIACLGPYLIKDGDGTREGTTLHLAWGSMMLRLAIDATLTSSRAFAGTFKFKISGVVYDDPDQVTGARLVLADPHSDPGGKRDLLATLLGDLAAGGALIPPHDDEAIRANADGTALPTASDFKKLGQIAAITYLGRNAKLDSQDKADFLFVYDVVFEHGSLLCGLHQRDDGVVDAFLCD
jgi:hypothetical protein